MNANSSILKKRIAGLTLLMHIAIIAVALTSYITVKISDAKTAEDNYDYVAISFSNTSSSSGSSSTKKNIQKSTVEKATARAINDKKIKVEALEEANETSVDMTPQRTSETKSNSDVKATSETDGEGDYGKLVSGKALGDMDFDGIGIFGRKVIYRAPVKKLAQKNGIIAVNMGVDRAGRVLAIAYNEKSSTIYDKELISKVLRMASQYRFEKDYTAPKIQYCKYIFIFEINK